MGACYSIEVKLKIQKGKEDELVNALNKKIADDTNVSPDKRLVVYDVEHFYPDYKAPYNLEQLCDIFFTKHQHMYDYTRENDVIIVDSGFDASYGWESVMLDAFELMAPFLKNGSKIIIDTDDGVDKVRVKDGKTVYSY